MTTIEVNQDIVDVAQALLKRVYTLEQRITSPSYVVPNGSSPTFKDIIVGDWSPDTEVTNGIPIQSQVSSPTNLVLTTSATFEDIAIDASWQAPVDGSAASYEVGVHERQADGTYLPTRIVSVVGTNAHIGGLLANRTYGVNVKAINRIGVVSAPLPAAGFQDISTGKDSTIPVGITGLKVDSAFSSVTLQWNDSTEGDVGGGAGQYQIQQADDEAFTVGVLTNSTTATIVSFTGLVTGKRYYYRVRAVDSSGNEGPWTTPVWAEPGGATGGASSDGLAPTSSPQPQVTGGPGFLFVRWTQIDNPDPVAYEVHISTAAGFAASASTRAAVIEGSIAVLKTNGAGANLAYDTDYYVAIVAKDEDGVAAQSAVTGPVRLVRSGTSDIAQGAITAASGIIASLDAGIISTGILNADRIAADSIRVTQLTVGARTAGQNLIPNGNLGNVVGGDAEGWYRRAGSAGYYLEAANDYWATPGRFAVVHQGGGDSHVWYENRTRIPVAAGDVLYGEVWAGATAATSIYMRLYFYTAQGTYLGERDAVPGQNVGTQKAARYSGRAVVPAEASYAVVNVITVGAGQHCVWSGPLLTKAIQGVQINDGAITAPKIVAGQINTDHITTSGIDAGVIKFGQMHGDRIVANTMDINAIRTSTLTSRTIFIGSGGQFVIGNSTNGVYIDQFGLRVFSGGSTKVHLASDGGAAFRGDITGATGTFSGAVRASSMIGGVFMTSDNGGVERIVINGNSTGGNEKRNRITFWSTNTNNPPAYIEVYNYIGQTTFGQVLYLSSGTGSSTVNSGNIRAGYLRLQPDYGTGGDGATIGVENSPDGGMFFRASSSQGVYIGLGNQDARFGNDYYANQRRLNLDCAVAVSAVNYNNQYAHMLVDFINPGGYADESNGSRIGENLMLIGRGAGTGSTKAHVFSSGTNIRIGVHNALYVQHPSTGAYRPVFASAFTVQSAGSSKTDVAKHDKGLAALRKVRPVKFRKKGDPAGPEMLGVLAEEVAAAIPEAAIYNQAAPEDQEYEVVERDFEGRIIGTRTVKETVTIGGSPDAPTAEAGTLFGVDPMGLISAILAGVQELDARLDTLEAAGRRSVK